MINRLFRLTCTIAIGIFTVTTGVFFSRLFIYIITHVRVDNLSIPFADIFYISTKAGLVGGAIGGIGIWLIHFFNLYRHK